MSIEKLMEEKVVPTREYLKHTYGISLTTAQLQWFLVLYDQLSDLMVAEVIRWIDSIMESGDKDWFQMVRDKAEQVMGQETRKVH